MAILSNSYRATDPLAELTAPARDTTTSLPEAFLNRETVAPVVLDQIVVNHRVSDPTLINTLLRFAGTIATPTMIEHMPHDARPALFNLTSPLECGRVLELPVSYEIDGDPHYANMKGVGITSHLRTKGSVASGIGYMMQDTASALARFPFSSKASGLPNHLGVQTLSECMDEYDGSNLLWSELGIDSEKVVMYGRITRMLGPDGEYYSPATLHRSGYLAHSHDPYLIFRLQRDNLRITDIEVAKSKLGKEAAARILENRAMRWQEWNQSTTSLTSIQYLGELITKIGHTQGRLISAGYNNYANSWHNEARNISLAGELVDVDPDSYRAENAAQAKLEIKKALKVTARIAFYIVELSLGEHWEISPEMAAHSLFSGLVSGLDTARNFDSNWLQNRDGSGFPTQSEISDLTILGLRQLATQFPQERSLVNAPDEIKPHVRNFAAKLKQLA